MKLLRINAEKPEKGLVSFVAAELASGRIIIYPTDTVYGIGCLLEPTRVKKIFEIKERDPTKPLSIAVKDLDSAKEYVFLSGKEESFIKENLDRPMTFLVKKRKNIPDVVTGGLDLVGIRIIDHPFVRDLLAVLGKPIITTSANISGRKAPCSIEDIDKEVLEKADIAIDAGSCRHKIPSKVVNASTGEVFRSS